MSDADDFRTRATEIFRQLRVSGAKAGPDPEEAADQATGSATEGAEPDARESQQLLTNGSQNAPLAETSEGSDVHEGSTDPEPPGPPEDVSEEEGLSLSYDEQSLARLLADAGLTPFPADDSLITDSIATAETADHSDAEFSEIEPTHAATAVTGSRPITLPIDEGGHRLDPLAGLGLSDPDTDADPDLTADREPGPSDRRHPSSQRPLPRILAIANQKGGVGKTTTAVNLGASLAELGYRVLVTDLDPQGNATTGLGINGRNLDASIYDVLLHNTPVEDVIEPTTLRNLFVIPATIDLAGAEIELVPVFSRELRLRRALDSIKDEFDFILIDCPPSLGLLTVNGLAAATEVVVPIQCEYYALEGLGMLLRNVNLVQGNLNSGLELSTIILTMYDARTRLAEQVVNDVRKHFGTRVCRSVVPRTVRLSEAPSFGQPIIVFDSSSRGAIAYRELAKEVSGGAPQRVR